jgi:hypothetical protein
MIIDAAFEIGRTDGAENINARSVAKNYTSQMLNTEKSTSA